MRRNLERLEVTDWEERGKDPESFLLAVKTLIQLSSFMTMVIYNSTTLTKYFYTLYFALIFSGGRVKEGFETESSQCEGSKKKKIVLF